MTVALVDVTGEPTAVVAATTTWEAWPALWPELSGEVWACLRAGGITSGAPNVMVYRDNADGVHIGGRSTDRTARTQPI